ncbi:MAG: amidohydrolase family protein [bacterium]|nr:amidohydrolase family protein [bacterium]
MVIRGKVVGTAEPVNVTVEGGKIVSVEKGAAPEGVLGGEDVWVSPGIFDVQVNGAGGISYNSAELTVDDVLKSCEWPYRAGTALFCPTLTTSAGEQAISALKVLAQACEEFPRAAATFVGFHVEGPYIASEDGPRGAHPLEHTRDPDWDEFCRYQDAAGGRIKIFTLAPEREGALEFIEKAAASGVIISLGHTGASRERVREAVSAGARMSTHLGNGAHAVLPRHDNYIYEQLAADELWAGLIPDGHHLPGSVLKCFHRGKQKQRICLVSDVASIAGLPAGVYDQVYGDYKVEIHENGKISLAGTPYLAGASLFLDKGIPNMVSFTDATFEDAIEMSTMNPARLLGVEDRLGSVEAGKDASLSLFRWAEGEDALSIVATVVQGEVVYRG